MTDLTYEGPYQYSESAQPSMTTHDIIDNRKDKLIDHLDRIPGTSGRARCAVGYLFLSGLTSFAKRLLRDGWDHGGQGARQLKRRHQRSAPPGCSGDRAPRAVVTGLRVLDIFSTREVPVLHVQTTVGRRQP